MGGGSYCGNDAAGSGSGKTFRPGSLTARILAIVGTYAAVLIIAFTAVNAIVESALNNMFPTIETVIAHEDALATDAFDALASPSLSCCAIVVFDGRGRQIYASNAAAAADMNFDYVKSLGEFESSEEEGFAGLSHCTVSRSDYMTENGALRTLAVAAPILNDAAYEAAIESVSRIWLVLIPVALLATLGAGALIARTIRRALAPLNAAITCYKGALQGGAGRTERNIRSDSLGENAKAPAHLDAEAKTKPLPPACRELAPIRDNFVDAMDMLSQEQEERKRLIADVSHDLKTPLTVIGGFAQALQDPRLSSDERVHYLAAIAEKSAYASALIDELFSLATMEHPDFAPTLEAADVNELLRTVVIGHMKDFDEAQMTVEADIPDEACIAQIDVQGFSRLFHNILANTIKHTGPGVLVQVSSRKEGGTLLVSIADTGPGMTDEQKRTAFEPFSTSNEGRTPGKGTGLGLAIARKCAETCGAFLYFADRPRRGFTTEVVCEIPL